MGEVRGSRPIGALQLAQFNSVLSLIFPGRRVVNKGLAIRQHEFENALRGCLFSAFFLPGESPHYG